jgi:hypothetical protein
VALVGGAFAAGIALGMLYQQTQQAAQPPILDLVALYQQDEPDYGRN